MPTAASASFPIVDGCSFPLWWGVGDTWLRRHGATRVLIVDDQYTTRSRLVDDESADESLLGHWLDVDVDFLEMPHDYQWSDLAPSGTFDDAWFERALAERIADPRPIACVLLDLLWGDETRIENASGPRLLRRLRHQLPDVPVLVFSNVDESLEVRRRIKEGRDLDISFQDYFPKRDRSGRRLLARLADQLVAWGDISDPQMGAFSPAMRRVARDMRRIAITRDSIPYDIPGRGSLRRPVIIRGAFGSGKNHLARSLHAVSPRRERDVIGVSFADRDPSTLPIALFGSGPFTDAIHQFYEVRPRDAAVLKRDVIRKPSPDAAYLTELGAIHRAELVRGTVLLDEIGTAPDYVQTRLLGVLDTGRFAPHNTAIELPSEGAIDVWFLITLSPEAESRLRPDLGTRLERGHQLHVPPLAIRHADVLPLVLAYFGASNHHPDAVFTQRAQQWLVDRARHLEVRSLLAVVMAVRDVTSVTPYGDAELEKACASIASDDRPTAAPSTLDILEQWHRQGVDLPTSIDALPRLRGQLSHVRGGAANAILRYIELCANAAVEPTSVRVWYLMTGDTLGAAEARTKIANLLLIDEAMTRAALRGSPVLRELAREASPRRKELAPLLEDL